MDAEAPTASDPTSQVASPNPNRHEIPDTGSGKSVSRTSPIWTSAAGTGPRFLAVTVKEGSPRLVWKTLPGPTRDSRAPVSR